MRLFAERGYDATSVADIQQAAGMAPGSGALYKHFPSKQALLEAGLSRFIREGTDAARETPDVNVALEEGLRSIGEVVLKALRDDEVALRIAWRDLRAVPDLRRRFVEERLQAAFRQLASWLHAMSERGTVEVDDPEATAAVLLSSLAFFRVMETLAGERPMRLDDDRFLEAWVSHAARALAAPAR